MSADLDWAERASFYRDALLEDCLPFWLRHAPDRQHGGWFFSLDRDGRVLDRTMPWPSFSQMTDVELDALWLYLQSFPPVEQ